MGTEQTPTDEAVIRRLAEMRGWKSRSVKYPNGYGLAISVKGVQCLYWHGFENSFDPLERISDARDCMMALPEEKHREFCNELRLILLLPLLRLLLRDDNLNLVPTMAYMLATPRQISLALYAAMKEQKT